MRLQGLLLAALAAAPARAERIASADQVLSWWLPPGWEAQPPKDDPNVVLEAKRSDEASIRLAPAPFPNDDRELSEKARAWANRLRKKGYPLPAAPSRARFGDGLELLYFKLDQDPPAIHGFFATIHGAYYLRTSKLEPKELLTLLGGIEVRKRLLRPYEAIWPAAPLKTVPSKDGAFAVQMPEPWIVEDSTPAAGAREALSLRAGAALLTVTATMVPPTPKSLRSAAEAALAAALEEGAEGGPVQFLVLRNGLLAYFLELKWPRSKDAEGQLGAFFAFGGRSYSVAAVNFALPVLRELLGSLEPPPPELQKESARLAEAWSKPAAAPRPAAPKRRAPAGIEPAKGFVETVGPNVLLLVSAALGLLGSWLYFSETTAERREAHDAQESHEAENEPVPLEPRPETGPLTIRRRYLEASSVWEIEGPEGRRFVVESRRSIWLLRWTAFFAFLSVWSWANLLHLEAWHSVSTLKLASALTFLLSFPAEALLGRRIRLLAADGRTPVLEARRSRLGLVEEYRVLDAEGKEVARLSRPLLFGRLGRKSWSVLTPGPESAVVLVIEGDPEPWLRKLLGHLFGLLREDLTLRLVEGQVIGRLVRSGSPLDTARLEFADETVTFMTTDVLSIAIAAVSLLDPDRPHPWPFG